MIIFILVICPTNNLPKFDCATPPTQENVTFLVKKVIGPDVKVVNVQSDDNRSYHISSEKIEKILGFKSKFTIEDAVQDLKKAFQNNMLPNSLSDEKYFNIKKMQSIKLS